MNSFTKPQLETITALAEAYFDKAFPSNEEVIPEFNRKFHRTSYVSSIIAGLTDQDYWGE